MPMTYTVVFREEPEGGYTVLVPALPEIVSYGENLAEAQRMALDAIQLAVEARREEGEEAEETGPVEVPKKDCTGKLHIYRISIDPAQAVPTHA